MIVAAIRYREATENAFARGRPISKPATNRDCIKKIRLNGLKKKQTEEELKLEIKLKIAKDLEKGWDF